MAVAQWVRGAAVSFEKPNFSYSQPVASRQPAPPEEPLVAP